MVAVVLAEVERVERREEKRRLLRVRAWGSVWRARFWGGTVDVEGEEGRLLGLVDWGDVVASLGVGVGSEGCAGLVRSEGCVGGAEAVGEGAVAGASGRVSRSGWD